MQVAGSSHEDDINMGMQVPVGIFSCAKQSLRVMSVGFLKIPAHALYYQAYYAWVIRDEKPMLLLNVNNMCWYNYHNQLDTRLLIYYTPSNLYLQ